MKKISICILIGFLLCACQTKDKPKEVMSQAQLSAFLVDVYLAEARLDQMPKPKDSTMKYFLPFEEKLLKQHGVSDSVVRITYTYYMEHPKELEQVYDVVIDTLMVREGHADIQNNVPQKTMPASAPPSRPKPVLKRPNIKSVK
jgi:hypothetical protein